MFNKNNNENRDTENTMNGLIELKKLFTVNSPYNEFGVPADRTSVIKKFVNIITNYSINITKIRYKVSAIFVISN
jgi:hypothetical protein